MDERTPNRPTGPAAKTATALVIAGGDMHRSPAPTAPDGQPWHRVIAADSGYDHAMALGIAVDLLIGDMDSISAAGLAHAEAAQVSIVRHPEAKDETDFELAIDAAAASGAARVSLHGGEGGRISHLIAVALGLTRARWQALSVTWHTASGDVRVATPASPVTVSGRPGDTVSLIPIADTTGVSTSGLMWVLDDEVLPSGTSRGLSNTLEGTSATVSVAHGALIVIMEGPIE